MVQLTDIKLTTIYLAMQKVCVCVCVRACVRAWVCVCMHVKTFIYLTLLCHLIGSNILRNTISSHKMHIPHHKKRHLASNGKQFQNIVHYMCHCVSRSIAMVSKILFRKELYVNGL